MSGADGLIRQEVRATESRIEFGLAGLLALLVGGTLAYVHSLFAPLVPTRELWAWTGSTAFVTALMILVPLLFYRRQPDAAEIARFWSPLGKVVAVLFDLAVAASVWVLLPYASEPLQLLMVIFYSAAISGQVIATAESIGTIIFGVIAVFGSAALFFLDSETLYATSLAIFLLAFGALMVGTALVLKQAIRSAVTQGVAGRGDFEGAGPRAGRDRGRTRPPHPLHRCRLARPAPTAAGSDVVLRSGEAGHRSRAPRSGRGWGGARARGSNGDA